ncbi:unnamed protein product [Menidia menidia]|uniref:(Atlantic silverside) hypothetical protein n=1 Tax=Menidia menidia TaxID=238744 RepID=A0A8S4B403_9TELE|nr:unnamed protein product [Menidia menidia]
MTSNQGPVPPDSVIQLPVFIGDVKGTGVSSQTIHNRLYALVESQMTVAGDTKTPSSLQWAQGHVTWTMQQWSTVLFSDE